jgi:hypothetical protein
VFAFFVPSERSFVILSALLHRLPECIFRCLHLRKLASPDILQNNIDTGLADAWILLKVRRSAYDEDIKATA